MDEIEDIQCQIVSDHIEDEYLKNERERHDHPYRKSPRENKAEYHRDRIRNGINNAIANVALRERLLAIVIDYHRRVLDNLPGNFYTHREEEPFPYRHARKEIPKSEVKKKTVDDVRKGVPIGKML